MRDDSWSMTMSRRTSRSGSWNSRYDSGGYARMGDTKAMRPPRNLRAALAYIGQGWRVFPLVPGAKEPIGAAVPHGCLDATTDGDQVLAWWGDHPDAGIGVATGSGSGIWVLDIDGPVGAINWWSWEAEHQATHTHTLSQRTGRLDGGRQLVYAWPAGRVVRSRASVLPGIDVRGEGGYVVAAPTVHPSGQHYRWEGKTPIAQAPDELLSLVRAEAVLEKSKPSASASRSRGSGRTPYGTAAAEELELDLASAARGSRDHLAFRVATRLLELECDRQIPAGETEAVLRRALGRCGYMTDERPQRGERGLQRVLASARRKVLK